MSNRPSKLLSASARSSPLSRVQVIEVEKELEQHHPEIVFETTFVTTVGDRDQKTSLKSLDKTDFFTKDIDEMLLKGICRIGIHSAKDLPDPMPEGLTIAAVTKGIDNSDSLVFRGTLKAGSIIATSSERREECVRQLCKDAQFVDIRGTIHQRLAKMESGEVDGVVIAEAALIRLGLTHLNRIKLPGETVMGQGQLAIVAREDDREVLDLMACIDSRRKTLYVGLKKPKDDLTHQYIHLPLIKIVPKEASPIDISPYTHFIFTSQSTVDLFFEKIPPEKLQNKRVLSVGKKTTERLQSLGVTVHVTAKNECSEGIVEELKQMDLKNSYLFWPHSALSRDVIDKYLKENNIPFKEWILYDTEFNEPKFIPSDFEEIFFTSPSTVDAYIHFFGEIPQDKILTPIGQVTCAYLQNQSQ